MIDGNKLGDVGFQYLGVSYQTMDCQKFVEQCLADCGLKKDLAGSNAWYREVMNHGAVMTPEECMSQFGRVPKGAFLFILEHDGKEPEKYKPDGIGNASHIGICTMPRGKGAINSSYSKGCVCESAFKGKSINGGWNRVGLWKEVAYDYYGIGTDPLNPTEPAPEPLPDKQTACVWADNGKPVNLRSKPSMMGKLIERVPCMEQVEILEPDTKWCKVKWKNYTGYMMTKFLVLKGYATLWTVTIHHVDKTTAEYLTDTYGGEMEEENE